MRYCLWVALAMLLLAAVDPALAQGRTLPAPAPAPLIGFGLPVVGLVIAAVWLVVRRFGRS